MRELDERSQTMINQARDQTKHLISQSLKKGIQDDEDEGMEKIKKEIEANQESALSLCTEKVLLARQAYDLIGGHMKRLDEDLNQFAEDLKQEGKIPMDEPATLPPVPLVVKDERRRSNFISPQSRRSSEFREREWERDRERDLELMPPPSSHKKSSLAPMDVDQSDPNEPTYCICHQVSFGDMIACDNENCQGGEWFHYSCVGLTPETRFKGKWFCPTCRQLM